MSQFPLRLRLQAMQQGQSIVRQLSSKPLSMSLCGYGLKEDGSPETEKFVLYFGLVCFGFVNRRIDIFSCSNSKPDRQQPSVQTTMVYNIISPQFYQHCRKKINIFVNQVKEIAKNDSHIEKTACYQGKLPRRC